MRARISWRTDRKWAAFGVLVLLGLGLLASWPPRDRSVRFLAKPDTMSVGAAVRRVVEPAAPGMDEATARIVRGQFARLPLIFEENRGQTDASVAFLARGQGYTLFLRGDEAVLKTRARSGHGARRGDRGSEDRHACCSALRVRLLDANPAPEMEGLAGTAGKSHYFKGNDRDRWVTGVRHFTRVRCRSVYPGTDLVYYGKQGLLEYDFVLEPGADPYAITMAFEGLSGPLSLDEGGNLLLPTAEARIVQRRPVVYQEGVGRRSIEGRYVVKGPDRVGFQVAAYDTSRTLVIDPVVDLDYATYLGGDDEDGLSGIAVDAAGSAYVVGEAESTDFPTTAGVLQGASAGELDVVVAKLSADGSALVYSTYLGGSGWEALDASPTVDGSGNAIIAGSTYSSDFPTTPGAYQTTYGGMYGEPFVAKLDADGANLLYSTYIGASAGPIGVAVDDSDYIYLTGDAYNDGFPVTAGAFQTAFSSGDLLFRTADGGGAWSGASTGLTAGTNMFEVAVDPVTGSTLYAATSEGMYKSLDGGASWTGANSGLDTNVVLAVSVDPVTPGTVYAGTPNGVFKSTDGAGAWSGPGNGFPDGSVVQAIAIDPQNPLTLYAGVSFGGGVYKSTDEGINWTQSNSGLVDPDIVDVAIDPETPSTVYAVDHQNGIFKSVDGGASWSDSNGSLDEPEAGLVAVHPSSTSTVFLGMEGGAIYKSTNGGGSWSLLNTGMGSDSDLRAIATSPTAPDTLYVGTDEGVFKTTDAGTTWSAVNTGLRSADIMALAVDPQNAQIVYAATQTPGDGFLMKLNPVGGGSADLVYSTFLGGTGEDEADGLIVDPAGVAWLSGLTRSPDFPSTAGAFQTSNGGGADAFLVGLNPGGAGASDLVYATYLGGLGDDAGDGIVFDTSGGVYLAGGTRSADFPTVTGAYQSTLAGSSDAFVARLNPAGGGASDLVSSTYLGGGGFDVALGVGLAEGGNPIIVGMTYSTDFPTGDDAFQDSLRGGADAFVAVLGTGGGSLAGATYFGGSGDDEVTGMTVDANGGVYIVGETESTNLQTRAFQGSNKGDFDGFVAKFSVNIQLQRPVALFTADTVEGPAPLTVSLNASTSSDPGGGTITAYAWSFGDGTTATGVTASHTFATPDSYVISLTVTNSGGINSEPATVAIVAGDGTTDDADLYASKAQFGVNFKNHARGVASDTIKLAGIINPAGLPADLSGVKVQLTINNIPIGSPTAVRSRARAARGSRASKGFSFLPLIKSNGAFSFSVKGADLRPTLGVRDETGEQDVRAEIKAEITGVALDTPTIKGVIETPFKTKKGSKSAGKFSFITLKTPTGAFKSQITTASEGATAGEYRVVAKGPIVGEFSRPLVPSGDVTITIGSGGVSGAVITVPIDAFPGKGSAGKSVYTYSKSIQEIPELKKFQINNAKKKFILMTNDLPGTGIPTTGTGVTTTDVPIVITVPTLDGPFQLGTTVELKRTNDASKKWKR